MTSKIHHRPQKQRINVSAYMDRASARYVATNKLQSFQSGAELKGVSLISSISGRRFNLQLAASLPGKMSRMFNIGANILSRQRLWAKEIEKLKVKRERFAQLGRQKCLSRKALDDVIGQESSFIDPSLTVESI